MPLMRIVYNNKKNVSSSSSRRTAFFSKLDDDDDDDDDDDEDEYIDATHVAAAYIAALYSILQLLKREGRRKMN